MAIDPTETSDDELAALAPRYRRYCKWSSEAIHGLNILREKYQYLAWPEFVERFYPTYPCERIQGRYNNTPCKRGREVTVNEYIYDPDYWPDDDSQDAHEEESSGDEASPEEGHIDEEDNVDLWEQDDVNPDGDCQVKIPSPPSTRNSHEPPSGAKRTVPNTSTTIDHQLATLCEQYRVVIEQMRQGEDMEHGLGHIRGIVAGIRAHLDQIDQKIGQAENWLRLKSEMVEGLEEVWNAVSPA